MSELLTFRHNPEGLFGKPLEEGYIQLSEDRYGPSRNPESPTGELNLGLPIAVWTACDETTAVNWTREPNSMAFENRGLLMYGPVTRDRLDALNLPEIYRLGPFLMQTYFDAEYPHALRRRVGRVTKAPSKPLCESSADLITYRAPSEAETRAAWEKTSTVVPEAIAPIHFARRGEDESTDDFYRRVADRVALLEAMYPTRVTAALAEEAVVPFHTANYWRKQLRKRGL